MFDELIQKAEDILEPVLPKGNPMQKLSPYLSEKEYDECDKM